MAFSFPGSPIDGQIYTLGGVSFRWSATTGAWLLVPQTPQPTIIVSTSAPSGTAAEGTIWIKV